MSPRDSRTRDEKRQLGKSKAAMLHIGIFAAVANLKAYIEHADHSVKTADSPIIPSNNPAIAKAVRENLAESLYYSFVILLYGIVEDSLVRTCDLISEIKSLPMHAKDLKGDTISQSTFFLSRLAKVSIDSLQYLPAVRDLAKIRNCIVHASGFIERVNEKDRNRINVLVKQSSGSISVKRDTLADQQKLVLSFEYCRSSLQMAASFFAELLGATRLVNKPDLTVYHDLFRQKAR